MDGLARTFFCTEGAVRRVVSFATFSRRDFKLQGDRAHTLLRNQK
jgi:hypothetical protein